MSVILRTGREIADLVDANPFKSVKVTPETRPGRHHAELEYDPQDTRQDERLTCRDGKTVLACFPEQGL